MKSKIILALLIMSSIMNAQEKKEDLQFSLEEAISYALEHNYQSQNATKDIEAAKKKKWETTASGLPQINAGADYQHNFVLQKSIIPAEFLGGNPGEFVEVAFGTKHTMNAYGNISQLIFDGSYLVGLQSAKVYLQISENAKAKTDLEIRELVVNSYGNVLLAQESISILEKNKTSVEKTLFETNETFKNGLTEEENVEQLQITLAQINSTLANAQRNETLALNMLKYVLGIDLQENITLTEKLDDLTQDNVDFTTSQSSFSFENTIDYKIQQNTLESNRLLLKLERSKALPSLAANYNFGYNAFNDQFKFFTNEQKWLNYSYLGISLKVPLFSSLARSARTQQARIAFDQAKINLKSTEQKMLLDYQKAKSDYELSLELYGTNKDNLRLAERIENKQSIKFKEGISSSFEFTEAQRQLYTAQQNYLQSMIDVINKKTALDKITNTK